jgi:uncharacterized protein (DUF1499 family)
MKKGTIGGLMMAVILTSTFCKSVEIIGLSEGKLAPCPDSPNCVLTQSEEKRHAMKPLPYLRTREASREKILRILKDMKRTEIVKITESYIHAECRTALFHFVDDVEFFLDETTRIVHFRSASRVGYYDFGLNRRRMKRISEKYLKSPEN